MSAYISLIFKMFGVERELARILAFVLVLSFVSFDAAYASQCGVALSSDSTGEPRRRRPLPSRATSNPTQGLISYLSTLIEAQALNSQKLTRLSEGLAEGRLENPITEQEASVGAANFVRRQGIQRFLNTGQVDGAELKNWVTQQLERLGTIKNEVERVRAETAQTFPIEFYKVESKPLWQRMRDFLLGKHLDHHKIRLPNYDFEISAGVITQGMWVQVMGMNPFGNRESREAITVSIGGRAVTLIPGAPVGNITWWSALEFANRLSSLHGLVPVYDLSQVEFHPETRAEDGSLSPFDPSEPLTHFQEERYKELHRIVRTATKPPSRMTGYRLPDINEIFADYELQNKIGTNISNLWVWTSLSSLENVLDNYSNQRYWQFGALVLRSRANSVLSEVGHVPGHMRQPGWSLRLVRTLPRAVAQ